MKKREKKEKTTKKRRGSLRLWIGLLLIVVALAAAGTGVYLFWQEQQDDSGQLFQEAHQDDEASDSYEAALSQYYEAILTEDGEKMAQIMAPSAYWTYYLETYDKSEEDVIETFAEECASILEDWESTYGSDISLSYQIVGASEPAQDGLDEWNSTMEELLGNDGVTISDAVTLEVELTVTGSTGSEVMTYYPTIAKMDDSWYILEEDSDELQGTA